jgi:hypothetical protein
LKVNNIGDNWYKQYNIFIRIVVFLFILYYFYLSEYLLSNIGNFYILLNDWASYTFLLMLTTLGGFLVKLKSYLFMSVSEVLNSSSNVRGPNSTNIKFSNQNPQKVGYELLNSFFLEKLILSLDYIDFNAFFITKNINNQLYMGSEFNENFLFLTKTYQKGQVYSYTNTGLFNYSNLKNMDIFSNKILVNNLALNTLLSKQIK